MYLLHRSVGPSVQFLYSGCMIAAKFRIMTIEQRAVRGTAENFVICDTQKSYSENLFRRLSEKLSGYFQFHVFHDIENLKIAAKSMQVNILLIGEEYGKEDRDEIPARQKYLLIGEKIPNERSPTEIPCGEIVYSICTGKRGSRVWAGIDDGTFFCHTGNGIYNHAKFRIWWGFRCNRTSG